MGLRLTSPAVSMTRLLPDTYAKLPTEPPLVGSCLGFVELLCTSVVTVTYGKDGPGHARADKGKSTSTAGFGEFQHSRKLIQQRRGFSERSAETSTDGVLRTRRAISGKGTHRLAGGGRIRTGVPSGSKAFEVRSRRNSAIRGSQ